MSYPLRRVSRALQSASRFTLVTFAGLCLTGTGQARAQGSVAGAAISPPRVVPVEPEKEFWSRRSRLLKYRCDDFKLLAQSRITPSVRFTLSEGPFNAKDCTAAIASLHDKGCFCDEAKLRCLETERVEPEAFLCSGDLRCIVFRGKKKGIVRIANVSDHITRAQCEKELGEVERTVENDGLSPKETPKPPEREI
jgi:hypothetical protein